MLLALEALPEKKLIAEELEANGAVCAIGAVGRARGIDMSKLCPDDRGSVARVFGLAPAMVAEIVYENDERTEWRPVEETPEARYARMLTWVKVQIKV